MPALTALGPALPPALDNHIKRIAVQGAAPLPHVDLATSVPGLGPYRIDHGGAFTLTVYSGPTMTFSAHAKLGTLLDTSA